MYMPIGKIYGWHWLDVSLVSLSTPKLMLYEKQLIQTALTPIFPLIQMYHN